MLEALLSTIENSLYRAICSILNKSLESLLCRNIIWALYSWPSIKVISSCELKHLFFSSWGNHLYAFFLGAWECASLGGYILQFHTWDIRELLQQPHIGKWHSCRYYKKIFSHSLCTWLLYSGDQKLGSASPLTWFCKWSSIRMSCLFKTGPKICWKSHSSHIWLIIPSSHPKASKSHETVES